MTMVDHTAVHAMETGALLWWQKKIKGKCECICVAYYFGLFFTSGWWWLVSSVCASFLRPLMMATRQTAVKIRLCIRESMKKWEIGSGEKLLGSEQVLDVKKIGSQVFHKRKSYEVLFNSFIETKSPTTGSWKKTKDCRCGVEWTKPESFNNKRIIGGPVVEQDTYKVSSK